MLFLRSIMKSALGVNAQVRVSAVGFCPSISTRNSERRSPGRTGSLCVSVSACILGLLTGTLSAQTVKVTNVPSNGYSYNLFPGDCPNGYSVPTEQLASGTHLEREHVMYNASTGLWVLYAHYENSNYTLAEVLSATSLSECGPYNVVNEYRPLGYESRDENIFEDTNGSAYLITASNHYGGANDTMAIFKLTPDYLSVDASAGVTWLFDNQYREAPSVIKSGGTYFLVTSQAAGWFPSQGGYATSATSMMSGWSALKPLGNSSTFGGQDSNILTIKGKERTSFVVVLDHLGGNTLQDTGSMWLPLLVDGATQQAALNWYSSWEINMKTGVLTLPLNPDAAKSGVASASQSLSTNPPKLASDGDYSTEWVSNSSTWPAWWMIDMGRPKPIEEVNVSWFMYKGSEAYYQYQIEYSNDDVEFHTIDRTNNQLYGFTSDPVNFTARYVRISLVNAVLWNNPDNWYTPQLWDVHLLEAPPSLRVRPLVKLTSTASSIAIDQPMTVTATVTGSELAPLPTGTVTLTGGGYTSAALALVAPAEDNDRGPDHFWGWPPHRSDPSTAVFTIPAGALVPGADTLEATFTPGLLSFPVYGTASATTSVSVNGGGPGGGYLIPDGTYTFINRNSGLAIDDPNSSTAEGTNIDQSTLSDGTNQKWQLTNVGDNNVKLICVASGLALDMSGQSTSPGGQVDQWPWNGGKNQIWHIVSLGGGYFEINNVNSGLTLEVPGQSTSSGTWLDQWSYNGGANQQWSVH